MWQEGKTGWDLNGPHPAFGELFEKACQMGPLLAGAKGFLPGCGRAHEGRWLAKRGYEVVCEDIVPEAIAQAALLGEQKGWTLRLGDARYVRPLEQGVFDFAFDRAVLCALAPEDRELYVKALVERLKPNGLIMGIFFTKVQAESPPPFAIPHDELLSLFSPYAQVVVWEDLLESSHPLIEKEAAVVFRKKGDRVGKDS